MESHLTSILKGIPGQLALNGSVPYILDERMGRCLLTVKGARDSAIPAIPKPKAILHSELQRTQKGG
jgi:hypothetical protein